MLLPFSASTKPKLIQKCIFNWKNNKVMETLSLMKKLCRLINRDEILVERELYFFKCPLLSGGTNEHKLSSEGLSKSTSLMLQTDYFL